MHGDAMTVGIVGGGAAGALTAAHLLRAGQARRVVVIEQRRHVGRGVAYDAASPSLVLNVPASGMTAFPDQPEHFARWAASAAGCTDGYAFLPRSLYGRYLAEVLDAAAATSQSSYERIEAEATGVALHGGGALIGLRDGGHVVVDAVVLALGLFPPAIPAGVGREVVADDRYVADPWAPGALDGIASTDDVLLLGTGLTAVDVALLLAERGHSGTVHAVSRHGLLPRPHSCTPVAPWPVSFPAAGGGPRTARDVLRVMRAELDSAARHGRDWRSVVDGLRPLTQHVWRSLPDPERRRLLSRVARYWEVHRHRMAPEVARRVAELTAAGRMQVGAGRVTAIRTGGESLVAHLEPGRPAPLTVDRVVNCTGPSCDVRRVDHPLVRQLLGSGTARPGPLGMGFDVDVDGALIDRRGHASSSVYAIGSLRKGALWETTAVPEIAAQAAALASVLATSPDAVRQQAVV